jgi:hypothetical protein
MRQWGMAISAIPQLDRLLPSMVLGPGFPGLTRAGSAGTTGSQICLRARHSGSDAGIQGQR